MNNVVVISCYLSVLEPYTINNDVFIVGSSDNGLTELEVDGTGYYGGVDLSRLTATTSSSSYSLQASITLSSYIQSHNGIRLGCSFTVIDSGGPEFLRIHRSVSYINTDTITIQQASNLFLSFFIHKIQSLLSLQVLHLLLPLSQLSFVLVL